MPYLRKCCCYFSLKTGGVILGSIGVVSSFLAIIICIIALSNVDAIAGKIGKRSDTDDLQIYLVKFILILLGTMTSSSLLIVGAIRRKRMLLLPWIILGGINLGVGILLGILLVILFMPQSVEEGFIALFIMVIIFGFGVYIWLAVLSLFQELRLEENSKVRASALHYETLPASGGPPPPAYSNLA